VVDASVQDPGELLPKMWREKLGGGFAHMDAYGTGVTAQGSSAWTVSRGRRCGRDRAATVVTLSTAPVVAGGLSGTESAGAPSAHRDERRLGTTATHGWLLDEQRCGQPPEVANSHRLNSTIQRQPICCGTSPASVNSSEIRGLSNSLGNG